MKLAVHLVKQRKILVNQRINFSKPKTNLYLNWCYNEHVTNLRYIVIYHFCLGSALKIFTNDEYKISLNGTVYGFSVSHSSIKKVLITYSILINV